ncbi:MAG: VOC family protein [Chloroflexi bacterium]|nr:VOC family protein [Chloroflexota bacterium]
MTIPGKPPAPTNLVHHVGIAVSDLDASIDFYRSLFGLEPSPIILREDIGVRG